MDKEEFRIKLEEINRLVEKKDYRSAMEVVDSIDWRRVKNVHTLCVVGEIYAANRRYEDSKEIFLLAYHRAPIGKNILYRLIEISLKMKDVDEANDFYEEYLEIAPNDSTQYVLKYKIEKVSNASIDEQIKTLEEYKEHEFTEKWSYELAKLYYQNGDQDKCLDLCNEMILWFSEGKYVLKAIELKEKMGQLSESEKESYEKQTASSASESEDDKEQKDSSESSEINVLEETPIIDGVKIDQRDVNNAESLQEKISKGIRDVFNGIKKEADKPAEFSKEEKEENPEEKSDDEIQEEMIKDIQNISSDVEQDVPDLEPEPSFDDKKETDPSEESVDLPEKAESENEEPDVESETDSEMKSENSLSETEQTEENETENTKEKKLPELEMPEEMQDLGIKNPLEGKDLNLEDMILAAASAQGIKIPEKTEEPAKKEKTEPKASLAVDDDEEPMTEEDLQAAEAEFLNGPSGSVAQQTEKKSELKDEIDDIDDDFSAILEEVDKFDKKEEFFDDDDDFDDGDFLNGGKVDEEARKLEKFVDSINKKEVNDNIIPREKKMTDEEEKLFTYFAKVPGLKEQIVNTLCDVQLSAADKTSKTGNIIVMGGRESGKTRLISGLIPAICKELDIEASKVAYVYADQINGKDPAAIVSKMAGGFLVIENANQLKKDTVNQLNKAMEFRTDGLIIILEDEKISMRKLIARFPKFTSKFTSMINIPVFTNDELVNFAKIYTKENGFTIDQMGMLALYNRISTGQKADQPMNIGSVKEIIDSAISKSQGGIRKLKKKKVNRDGFTVLYEKDFN